MEEHRFALAQSRLCHLTQGFQCPRATYTAWVSFVMSLETRLTLNHNEYEVWDTSMKHGPFLPGFLKDGVWL